MIQEHLVCGSEIARRTGVSRATVVNWASRHPQFAALKVATVGGGPVYWWPQVEQVLAELGLPNETAIEVQRRRRGSAQGREAA